MNCSFINISLLYYTLLEIKWHEVCPLCPRFRIAWKLMYRYSVSVACVFTIYLVFVVSNTVSAFVFVVFSSRSCWRTSMKTFINLDWVSSSVSFLRQTVALLCHVLAGENVNSLTLPEQSETWYLIELITMLFVLHMTF